MGKCQCGRLKGNPCGPLRPNTINVTMPISHAMKPQLGRTGVLAEDLKELVELLRATTERSPKCCAGCERDLAEAAAAGTAARSVARLWPQPLGLFRIQWLGT